jgi:transposase
MDSNTLFTMALGLENQWEVRGSRFEGEPKSLDLKLDFKVGAKFGCPCCGKKSPVHDTAEKRWRHLNFFQYPCELIARVPRVNCGEHGVRQVEVPWARPGSGFTLMFEAMAMLLCGQMPVAKVSEMLGVEDTRLWRMLCALVEKAQAQRDWSGVRKILIDETSSRRGHRYVSTFVDAETHQLLFVAEGKSAEAVKAFAEAMKEHGANPRQIRWVGMDMSPAFIKGAETYLPRARKVFDCFHLMQMVGKALDEVRRSLAKLNREAFEGSRWSILGNEWTRNEEQQKKRRELCVLYPKLGRAMGLRESFQNVLESKNPEELDWWCRWASSSRLEPFQKLAKSIRAHKEGILAYFDSGITSAAIEAINGKIQLAKRIARGFRSFRYLRACAYLKCAKLDFNLPDLAPT